MAVVTVHRHLTGLHMIASEFVAGGVAADMEDGGDLGAFRPRLPTRRSKAT